MIEKIKNNPLYGDERKIVLTDNYKGLTYYIVTLGSYPCVYVNVKDTILDEKPYEDIPIKCHGGLTYSADSLWVTEDKGWFIGWDYAHLGDLFYSQYLIDMGVIDITSKEWTIDEIKEECKNVIDQLIELTEKNVSKQDKQDKKDIKTKIDYDIEPKIKCKVPWIQRWLVEIFGCKLVKKEVPIEDFVDDCDEEYIQKTQEFLDNLFN